MCQTIETNKGIESKEITDLSEEIWPQDRGKEYTKEELQKNETWEEITDLFEFTINEVIIKSSDYWHYFWILDWAKHKWLKEDDNYDIWMVEKNKETYIWELKEILANKSFRDYYKWEWEDNVLFTDIWNTTRSISQLQKDFWKKFTDSQLSQITKCINKIQEKNYIKELIPTESNVYVYYDSWLVPDEKIINGMFEKVSWTIHIDNYNEKNVAFIKNLKNTIEPNLVQSKPAHICIMTHWNRRGSWVIDITWFGWYLKSLDEKWVNLNNLSISTFSCWWWEFQLNLYRYLKEKWCKTFPSVIYSHANINQMSRWNQSTWYSWVNTIRYSTDYKIWEIKDKDSEVLFNTNFSQYTNDPMIQISNTTIEQQIIEETVTDKELKDFLLDQPAFQIADAENQQDQFYNVA